jgi:hypothetical protein
MNTFRRMCEELCQRWGLKATVKFASPATDDVVIVICTETWPRVLRVYIEEAIWAARGCEHVAIMLRQVRP